MCIRDSPEARGIGIIFHNTMEKIYKPFEGKKIDPEKLLAMLQDEIAAAELKAKKDLLAAEAAEKEAEEKKLAAEKLRRSLMAQLATLEEKEKEFTVAKTDLLAKLENMPTLNAPPPKEVRPPTPKDIPRNKDGNALLQERKVLVSNGKVIPFVDPGKQMETAIKNRLKMIIDKNKINVGEGNYISNEAQAMKLIDEFNKDPAKNKYFDLKLVRAGRQIRVEIVPTEECGEEPEKAVRGIFGTVLRNMPVSYTHLTLPTKA